MSEPSVASVSNECGNSGSEDGTIMMPGPDEIRLPGESTPKAHTSFDQLQNTLERIWSACIPPGDFNGTASELRRAYVELVQVVAGLLGPDTEGRLPSDAVYSGLSDHAGRQLDPSRGGVGVTRLGNAPSVLVTRTEMYERTRYVEGETVTNLHVDAKPSDVAQAAFDLFHDGVLDTLDALHTSTRPHGHATHGGHGNGTAHAAGPGTTRRTARRGATAPAIEPNVSRVKTGKPACLETPSSAAEGRSGDPFPVLDERGANRTRCGIAPLSAPTNGDGRILSEGKIQDLKRRSPDGAKVPWADIPTGLYERIVAWNPVIAESEPLAAILQHVLFAKGRDPDWFTEGDNVGVIIPHEKIFAAFGIEPQVGWNAGLSAATLLELYRREVDPEFEWSGWHHEEGKARVVKSHGIPDSILNDAKKLMLSPEEHDDWTYLITGKSASNRRWTSQLREDRREVIADNEPVIEPPDSTRRIQEYLNGLDQQYFGHGAHGNLRPSKLDEAIWTVADTINEEQRRDQELRKLYWMRKFPQPLYMPCDRFPRLKADHHNQAMNLPSEVLRAMYTTRDYELDLSKAHLASYVPVAKREGLSVPTLEEHLQANLEGNEELLEEGDLWHDLASYLDLDGDPQIKRKVVKKAYSLVYGQEMKSLWFNLLAEWGKRTGQWLDTTEPLKGLRDHPLMDELLSTRDQLKAIINQRGGLEDANGRTIPLKAWDETKKPENRWRGVMAYVNASFEQELMAAAFDEARDEQKRDARARFRIWLYQADGVTVRIGSKASHSNQIERLQKAVEQRADALGVPTELEVDFTPTD